MYNAALSRFRTTIVTVEEQ